MQTQVIKQLQASHLFEIANQPQSTCLGVGVLIIREGRLLLGKRKGAHGAGMWSVPGGKMEFGSKYGGVPKWERPEEAAVREVSEETNLEVRKVTIVAFHNHFWEELGQLHKSIFVVAEVDPGEPALMEPEKCEQWGWFGMEELPEPLFPPLKWLVFESEYFRSPVPPLYPVLSLQ